VPDHVAIFTNHDLQALEEATISEIAQSNDVRSRVAIPRRIIDTDSLLSTSRITTRRKERSYWHLVTLTVLCDNRSSIHCIFLKSYTHKMIARCMTRQNTSSQNTTESNPVHETSSTNSDEKCTRSLKRRKTCCIFRLSKPLK